MSQTLLQSTRIALAAYLHDLGKFSQRAGIDEKNPRLPMHIQLYCPRTRNVANNPATAYPTHIHAAHTALSFELIEKHFDSILGDECAPFTQGDEDSLVNVASRHHKPETFLDWVVARADRLASGFEREKFEEYNQGGEEEAGPRQYRQARLLSLFEQISDTPSDLASVRCVMPLEPMTPSSIFPKPRNEIFPKTKETGTQEYAKLWQSFSNALEKTNKIAMKNPAVAFDTFDSLWLQHTHCIPSATVAPTRPDVSLYDHSRTTAALAVALWRWHSSWQQDDVPTRTKKISDESAISMQEKKFLLIQGDFTGIQNFIFGGNPRVNKKSADILRGKSFFVTLLCELTAIGILEALELPSVCQVMNAAGKFLIVAPNTEATKTALQNCKQELDDWFVKETLGVASVVISEVEASQADFVVKAEGQGFSALIKRLFQRLESAKLRKFNSAKEKFGSLDVNYPKGSCAVDSRLPAQTHSDLLQGEAVSHLGASMLVLGNWLRRWSDEDLVVVHRSEPFGSHAECLETIFPARLRISFIKRSVIEMISPRLTQVSRIWDYKLPETLETAPWNGFAHRQINAWAPWIVSEDRSMSFEEIAAENIRVGRKKSTSGAAVEEGIEALAVIKGDVDNLGRIFQSRMQEPTFAKMASLSRQLNSFFSGWLPVFCRTHQEFKSTYTLFAGGDDFFLIAPWRTGQALAKKIRDEFCRYSAQSALEPKIHLSIGIATTKPGNPISALGDWAEDALEQAKSYKRGVAYSERSKDAVTIFGQSLGWEELPKLAEIQNTIEALDEKYDLPTAWYYNLLSFMDAAKQSENDPRKGVWKAHLSYSTRRFVERNCGYLSQENQVQVSSTLIETQLNWLRNQQDARFLKIALFNHIYSRRKS
jgi:CRISPR-associated protein Csm1